MKNSEAKPNSKKSPKKSPKKTLSIFGSTGSIGKNAISVAKNSPENFSIEVLVAKNDVKTLISQALELKPKFVVIENPNHFLELREGLSHLKNCEILCGSNAILEVAKIRCDLMISAIVGAVGMLPTLNAIRAGSNVALANKESLVCAGRFLTSEAKKHKVSIFPIDSEHNAIFQIFENQNLSMIEEIVLTASGGPFFNSAKNFADISVAEALNHPKWQMGSKISIDSATMMNKGLEMIEAFYLFPIKKDQIKILVHPQSIIHGIVNYLDGASLAMMSLPDMQVPISYALSFPNRMKINHQKLDLAKIQKLEFFAVDENKFPAIKICHEALKQEGNSTVILNASNEVAVEKFLRGEIKFNQITNLVLATLNKIPYKKLTSIEDVVLSDNEAREVSQNIIL